MAGIMDSSTASYYTTLLCGALLLATVVFKLKKATASSRHNAGVNLPPGPWALPVIGSIHCLLGSLPHHAMRDLSRRHGPVVLLRLGHVHTLVLSSPEAAREVMKTHDVAFANRAVTPTASVISYGGRDIVFAPFGKHLRELRKLCALELLSPRRVRSFRHVREEEAARLARSVAAAASSASASSAVNVSELVKIMTNDITMRAIIGDRCPQREEYLEALDKAMDLLAGFNLVDLFPGSPLARVLGGRSLRTTKRVHQKLHQITDAIIQSHGIKDTVGDDIGAHHECEDILDDLFAGGSETTSTTILWAMSELMRSHRVMEQAKYEIRQVLQGKTMVSEADIEGRLHYLQLVIKETLRLHPPVPIVIPRLCSKPNSKIMGYDIPQGTSVLVNVSAIGRDEKIWKDANEFRPDRFKDDIVDFSGTDFRFIPGGSGRRMCPGLTFGVFNIEIALDHVMDMESKGRAVAGDDADGGGASERESTFSMSCCVFRKMGAWRQPLLRRLSLCDLALVHMNINQAKDEKFFSAGYETTTTATIWAISELINSPRAMEKAQSDIRKILGGKSIVEEANIEGQLHYFQMTIRLHPPVPLLLPRLWSEPCKIMGYDIPQETTIFVNAWTLGRNKKHWIDASEFRPERFEDGIVDFNGLDFRFLPCGAGRRICPGLMFELFDIELTLVNLLYHFNWRLPTEAYSNKLDMTEAHGITMHSRIDIWLEATPYSFCS
uniref:Cytochrome P450 n=1 Tax=Oryza glumipatula TaxID=40148 RepID=A0A0D9YK79_9ORYZ